MSPTPLKLTKIVTHPGQAHRDDLLAVSCLLAVCEPPTNRILLCRREPTPTDLADPTVAVVDVGGRHEPYLLNFDHHHFSRDYAPTCALTLVLDHLGLLTAARDAYDWFEFAELIDSKGPDVTARWLGISRPRLVATVSPVEGYVLRWFQQISGDVYPGVSMSSLLHGIGRYIVDYLDDFVARMKLLNEVAKFSHLTYGGVTVPVIDATAIPGHNRPTLGLEKWTLRNHPTTLVTVTNNDRGPGLSLYRRGEGPVVDFSRAENDPDVTFAHKTGFLAKTREGADPNRIIRIAMIRTDRD